MANDVLKFVDSIAASPTTRLDLNTTSSGWKASVIDPGVPPTSLSVAQNAMRDGGWVSSSVRGMRTITLGLTMTSASQDTNATAIQNLVRELDREWNYLMFQPDGASKPVFFRTYRATPATIQYVWSAVAHHAVEIQLQADPWALGLRETVSVGTVNNNPAAASNGCYFDVAAASCIGDVAAPVAMRFYNGGADVIGGWLSGTRTQMATTRYLQAESMTLGTDTTNPGGGADAGMSGSGSTNYRRTSFATATMVTRLSTATNPGVPGAYRLLIAVRLSNNTTDVYLQATHAVTWWATSTNRKVLVSKHTNRQIVDLGIVAYPTQTLDDGSAAGMPTGELRIAAERTAGAGTIDFDCIIWVPAEEQTAIIGTPGNKYVLYYRDAGVVYDSGDPFAGTAVYVGNAKFSGALPTLSPNMTNRFTYVADTVTTAGGSPVTYNSTVTLYYYPRYLFIRPSAT